MQHFPASLEKCKFSQNFAFFIRGNIIYFCENRSKIKFSRFKCQSIGNFITSSARYGIPCLDCYFYCFGTRLLVFFQCIFSSCCLVLPQQGVYVCVFGVFQFCCVSSSFVRLANCHKKMFSSATKYATHTFHMHIALDVCVCASL